MKLGDEAGIPIAIACNIRCIFMTFPVRHAYERRTLRAIFPATINGKYTNIESEIVFGHHIFA